ncbi:flavin reductase family protein [Rhizohabitans arisaemae]|uniref:flavin reductase family protein n=1 Tax=Rhizohabitans arisaemae TaxID=2720610 RepID=UPI0024B0EE87|nr:flavin reductase family protein [Rhizohabitans arisaemae]
MSPDRAYRATMGLFATGVTVITVGHLGKRHGMTASAVMSVSLRPQLLAVAVDVRSYTADLIGEAGHFTVNVLAEAQADTALRFARPMAREAELFGTVPVAAGATGDPLLPGTLARLSCEVASAHREGDHTLFVGRVAELWRAPEAGPPLIFYGGRLCSTNCRACIARVDPTEALYTLHGG